MWRGYSNINSGGEGIAIGFNKDCLIDNCNEGVFEGPQKVAYEDAEIDHRFQDIRDKADPRAPDFALLNEFRKALPFIKHDAFSEEEEWRIAVDGNTWLRMSRPSGNYMILPFAGFVA